MKILILGTGSLDCAAASCGIALRSMGHEVRHFDPDEHPAYLASLRRTWQTKRVVNRILDFAFEQGRLWEGAFVREAGEYGPDLILVIPITILSPSTVGALKRATGARLVGWFQDAVVNFGAHLFLLAEYDALFFKDPYIVEKLRESCGLEHVHLLPEACEPTVHRPVPLSDEDQQRYGCDLMIYGNPYAYRLKLLEGLKDQDFRMYGAGPIRTSESWYKSPLRDKWQGKDVHRDDKGRAVLGAKIVINSSHYGEIRSANARTFEVAGIGGFQVADAPGIADLFIPGEEIVTFRGPKQLREVVLHYLARPEERQAIAERGRARALRDHTFRRRLERLLEVLEVAGKPS